MYQGGTVQVLEQQNQFSDGHTYAGDHENNYLGKEEDIATRMGSAWMTIWLQQLMPSDLKRRIINSE